MNGLRIISDVHGKLDKYYKIVEDANSKNLATLQLGDLGFGCHYHVLMRDKNFDVTHNKFFMGNHDQYDYADLVGPNVPKYQQVSMDDVTKFHKFNLGSWGIRELGGIRFFFVRGAFSVDKQHRRIGLDWWEDEEIQEKFFNIICLEYERTKPEIMITHDCPQSIGHHELNQLKNPRQLQEWFGFNPETFSTRTGVLLDRLFAIHQPKYHYWGHYHKSWTSFEKGTTFRCLNELEYVDITK